MQDKTNEDEKNDTDDKHNGSPKPVKQKHVGDETPNPLPDDDYTSKQPAGDDSQANAESDSAVK